MSQEKTCCVTQIMNKIYKKIFKKPSQKYIKESKANQNKNNIIYHQKKQEKIDTQNLNVQLTNWNTSNRNENETQYPESGRPFQVNLNKQDVSDKNKGYSNQENYKTHLNLNIQTLPEDNAQAFKGPSKTTKTSMETFLQRNHSTEDLTYYYAFMGEICLNLKDAQAVEYLQKSLQIYTKQQQTYFEQIITIYNNVGLFYQQNKQYSQSIEYFKKCLNTMDKYLNKLDQRRFLVEINLAYGYIQMKNVKQSCKIVGELNAKKKYLMVKQHHYLLKEILELQNQIKMNNWNRQHLKIGFK